MVKKALYPGTFDPVTNGHVDIIQRAATIFDEVWVTVGSNTSKKPYFTLEERMALLHTTFASLKNVRVMSFEGLLVEFARQHDIPVMIRGLRAVQDFEYEFQLAGMNRTMAKDIETLFMIPSQEVMFISSSLVKEVALLGGDIRRFVPTHVVAAFERKKV